ncbi:MAG: hypoxanthine phosphoribosyltransferase, partial [candidate division WOR-3 bacterium]
GAAIFLADLIRELRIPLELDFIKVSSYLSGDKSSGRVRIFETGSLDIKAKDVIIVEDIVDTGLTLRRILQRLRPYKPKSLEVCVLLDKKDNRKVDLRLKYIGFEIPNIFVVGYGLDFVNRYRNIPYIGVLNGRSRKS